MKRWLFEHFATGLALASCMFAGLSSLEGATLRVRQDGTGNYTTIQACVNAMAGGDTCLVSAGTYPQRITFPSGKSGTASQRTTIKAETPGTVDMLGFDTANCNFLRIEGFNITVTNTQSGYPSVPGVDLRSSNLQIVSNYVHDIQYIALYGHGSCNSNYVAGNRIYNVGMGLIIHGTGWLVESNEIQRLQYYSVLGDSDYVTFFGSYHVLRYNFLHGTSQSEIGPSHVDGFTTYDNNNEAVQHIRIEGNRVQDFYHQGVLMAAQFYSNSFDVLICNNIFRQAASWGVDAFNGIRDVKIYHNLFMDINSVAVGINQGATGECKNNIFYNVTSWDSATLPTIGGNNIWYRPGGSVGARFIGDLLNVNPQFVDVANGNYHLSSTSPARDAGVALALVPSDLDNLARPQGTGWDIGPYEFVTSSPTARLLAPVRQGSNFVFTLSGGPGLNYRIDASSNLVQWSQIKTVALVTGAAQFTNPATIARRFYRSVWLP